MHFYNQDELGRHCLISVDGDKFHVAIQPVTGTKNSESTRASIPQAFIGRTAKDSETPLSDFELEHMINLVSGGKAKFTNEWQAITRAEAEEKISDGSLPLPKGGTRGPEVQQQRLD